MILENEEAVTETPVSLTRRKLTIPRATAMAGILFALLYGIALILIRSSIPANQAADSAWLETTAKAVSLALNLVLYAGISFLWFIGAIRDRMGELEDRFFATVFLGSDFLYLALNFVAASLTGGILSGYALEKGTLLTSGVYTYSRRDKRLRAMTLGYRVR